MRKPFTYTATILLALFGLLALAGGWICMILLQGDYVRYVTYGCFALSFILIVISIFLLVHGRKLDNKAAKDVIAQLDRLHNGDLSPRIVSHCSAPMEEVSSAINTLPERSFKEEIPDHILNKEEFEAYLSRTLHFASSIRGCLILIGLESRGTPKAYEHLGEEVVKVYEGRAIGEIKGGYAVYEPSALSVRQEEGKAKRFISTFTAIEDASSLKPTTFGAKIALTFYPDFPEEELWERAYSAFEQARPLFTATSGESNLTALTVSEEGRKDEVPFEDYYMALATAKGEKDRKKALRLLLIRAALGLGFDQVGLALFDSSRQGYHLIEEIHAEGKGPSFKLLAQDGLIPDHRIDPFYELALDERLCCVSNSLYLPSRPAAILDSLGLRSIACASVGTVERRLGFVYLTSGSIQTNIDAKKQVAIQRLFRTLSAHLLIERDESLEKESEAREACLTDVTGRYLYEIDPATHRILHLSANLAAAYHSARVGDLCHRALLGSDEPCPNCPLLHEEGFRKALPEIGPGLLSFSVLSKFPKATILLSKQERGLTPRRLDKDLYILNRRALMADLESALLQEQSGYALLFHVENAVLSAGKIKDGTVHDIMAALLSRLSISSLDDGLYRYDDDTFAYLLPDSNKDGAFEVAKSVAIALSNPIPLQNNSFVPELSYIALSYPVEVSCVFDLESLTRTCLSKVPNLGKGRMIPIDDEEAPLVLPRSYKEDALKKAMAKGAFPLSYTLVRENASMRPRYVKIGASLSLSKGEKANADELRALLNEERLLSKLEEGELNGFFQSFKANDNAFKSSSLKGVILRIGKASLFSSTYMRILTRGVKDAHVPGGFIHLVLPSQYAEDEQEKLVAALATLKEAKIVPLYLFDEKNATPLAYLGEHELEGALSSTLAEDGFKKRLAKARELRTNLILPGIEQDEQRSYAISLSVPYGEGKLYGQYLEEKDFLEAIQ